jgi:hypothetical protein
VLIFSCKAMLFDRGVDLGDRGARIYDFIAWGFIIFW